MNQESPLPRPDENLLARPSLPPSEISGPEVDQKFDELLENDYEEDFEDELAEEIGLRHARKRKGLYCFHCHRPEGHYLAYAGRWYFSYLLGLTFGLIRLVGPFQCQCCGHRRLMFSNWSNLRYLLRDKGTVGKSKSSRNRRK